MPLLNIFQQRKQKKIFKIEFQHFLKQYSFLSDDFINFWVEELGNNYIEENSNTYKQIQMPYRYDFSGLSYWISIDKVEQYIKENDLESKKLKLRSFCPQHKRPITKQSSATIWYTSEQPKFKDSPIFVLKSDYHKHIENVVVDGNHRVSYYIQQDIPKIPAVILTDKILQEHTLFVSNYSKSVHTFVTAFFLLCYNQNHDR